MPKNDRKKSSGEELLAAAGLDFYPKPIILVQGRSIHQASTRLRPLFSIPEKDDLNKSLTKNPYLSKLLESLHGRTTPWAQIAKVGDNVLRLAGRPVSDGWLIEVALLADDLSEEFRNPLTPAEIHHLPPDVAADWQHLAKEPTSLESFLFRVATRLSKVLAHLPVKADVKGAVAKWQTALLLYEDGFFWEKAFIFGDLNGGKGASTFTEAVAEFARTINGESAGTLCAHTALKQESYYVTDISMQLSKQRRAVRPGSHFPLRGTDGNGRDAYLPYRVGNLLAETELCVPITHEGTTFGILDVQTNWLKGEDGQSITYIDVLDVLRKVADQIAPEVAAYARWHQQIRVEQNLEHLQKATLALSNVDAADVSASLKILSKIIRPNLLKAGNDDQPSLFIEVLWRTADNSFLRERGTFYQRPKRKSTGRVREIPLDKAIRRADVRHFNSVCSAAFQLKRTICFQGSRVRSNNANYHGKKRKTLLVEGRSATVVKYSQGSRGFRSELAIPVADDRHRYGVLNFEVYRHDAFGPVEIQVLEVFAKTLAAIYNGHLASIEKEEVQEATKLAMADAAHVENNILLNAQCSLQQLAMANATDSPLNAKTNTEIKILVDALSYLQNKNSYHAAIFDDTIEFRPTSLCDALSTLQVEFFKRNLIPGRELSIALSRVSSKFYVSIPLGQLGGLALHSIVANMIKNEERYGESLQASIDIAAYRDGKWIVVAVKVGTPRDVLEKHYLEPAKKQAGQGIREIHRAARWLRKDGRECSDAVTLSRRGARLLFRLAAAIPCALITQTKSGSGASWCTPADASYAASAALAVCVDTTGLSDRGLRRVMQERHRLPRRRMYVGPVSGPLEALGFVRVAAGVEQLKTMDLESILSKWARRYFKDRGSLVVFVTPPPPTPLPPYVRWLPDAARPKTLPARFVLLYHLVKDGRWALDKFSGSEVAQSPLSAAFPWRTAITNPSFDSVLSVYEVFVQRIVFFDNRLITDEDSPDSRDPNGNCKDLEGIWVFREERHLDVAAICRELRADIVVVHQRAISEEILASWWESMNSLHSTRVFLTSQVQRQRASVRKLDPIPNFVNFSSVHEAFQLRTKYAISSVFRP